MTLLTDEEYEDGMRKLREIKERKGGIMTGHQADMEYFQRKLDLMEARGASHAETLRVRKQIALLEQAADMYDD